MHDLSRHLHPPRRGGPWIVAISVSALTLTALLSQQAFLAHQAGTSAAEQVRQLRAATAKPVAKIDRKKQDEEKRWQSLRTERTFAWAPVFLAVEQCSSPDVAFLEFKPDKAGARLSLRGEGRNLKSILECVATLQRNSSLDKVHLARQAKKGPEPNTPLVFEIKASINKT